MSKEDPSTRKARRYAEMLSAKNDALNRFGQETNRLRLTGPGWDMNYKVMIPIIPEEASPDDSRRIFMSGGTWLDWQWMLFYSDADSQVAT